MCHMTPGHTGLPHKTRTTGTGGRCFRPIFVMHTCPLRRNSSPAVYSVDMGRVYIHWRRLCGVTPCCREICKENSHWTPPITSSPLPHHHGFLKLQPFMGLLQVPFDRFSYFQHHGVYHNNSQTVLCSTFSSPSTNFPPRFFSLTSSPSLRSRTWMGDPLLLLSSSFAFDFRHFHLQVF